MKGQISFNGKRHELSVGGKVLVRSNTSAYLVRLVEEQKHPKVLAHGITNVEVVTSAPSVLKVNGSSTPTNFTIDERFEFMDELIDMVIDGTAKSIIITGEGGIGKTHEVRSRLVNRNLLSKTEVEPNISDLDVAPISIDDQTPEEIEAKVLAVMNRPKHDYVLVKGYSSAAGLYRTLWENRDKIIIFDDCDSIQKDVVALALLKAALDSYDERWIYWNTEKAGSDLPSHFRFTGRVIFISNLPMSKLDGPMKTRALKVDVSMTKQQRIDRMRSVLHNVLPEVGMQEKKEALKLMEDNLSICNGVDFRTLMNVIAIRIGSSKNWKKLAIYALTQS
jgi:hypothetical protein